MTPPVYTILAASAAVSALLGPQAARLYPFGEAPQGVAIPYAVWQTITGIPDLQLSGAPEGDDYAVQIDVYGDSGSSVINVARAMRDALEATQVANVVGARDMPREIDTDNYRYMLTVDFITTR